MPTILDKIHNTIRSIETDLRVVSSSQPHFGSSSLREGVEVLEKLLKDLQGATPTEQPCVQ